MFTGIIECTGRVVSLTAPESGSEGLMASITQLIVDPGKGYATNLGDSVAVNGCCLTVTSNKMHLLAFDVSAETMRRTTMHALREGAEVNLERALKLGDRLGGHMVSGHVDGAGTVDRIQKLPDGWDLTIALPRDLGRYVIPKGSICLDGVSLTVNALEDRDVRTLIRLMLIPTTVSLTSFKALREGQELNVEVDMVGKFLERLGAPWQGR
jgi:riboflavin synthase